MIAQIKLSLAERNTALQWASATRKQIFSRFRSFFTSRDASPTSPLWVPVANEFSVVIDILPPDEAECVDPASPPGQPATAIQGRCCRICIQGFAPDPAHPIVVLFQRQELGKAALGFSMPMITGLLFNQYHHLSHLYESLIALALCVGFTATWNGIMLRGVWPRVATMSENIGVVPIFMAFFGLVASFLMPSLVLAPWLCCGLSCLPFLLCIKPLTVRTTMS